MFEALAVLIMMMVRLVIPLTVMLLVGSLIQRRMNVNTAG